MAPQNHAIVIQSRGVAAIEEVPIPKLRDDYMTVKIKAVAVNPTDWKHIDNYPTPGVHVGCDFSGVVEEVGSKVAKPWKKGQRVAGWCHGANSVYAEDGAFADYATVKGDVQMLLPDSVSFEDGATFGAGIATVGLTMYKDMGLPLPTSSGRASASGGQDATPILIYGGSTATGCLMIQFAKLSGLKVYTTCRAHNFEYVRSIGADAVFDYTEEDVAVQIRKHSGGLIRHVVDCIAQGSSTMICAHAMSEEGGLYNALRQYVPEAEVKALNPKITLERTLGYTIFGERFTLGDLVFDARPKDFEFGIMWWKVAESLVRDGKVKAHKISVNQHGAGLEGVMKGIDSVRRQEISGKKLVYTL